MIEIKKLITFIFSLPLYKSKCLDHCLVSPEDVCLHKKVNTIGVVCEYIVSRIDSMQPTKELDDSDTEGYLSNFPINTDTDYDELKVKLEGKDYYNSVVSSFDFFIFITLCFLNKQFITVTFQFL